MNPQKTLILFLCFPPSLRDNKLGSDVWQKNFDGVPESWLLLNQVGRPGLATER